MRKKDLGTLVACGALAALPLMISSVSVAQAPPAPAPSPPPVIAPSLPATYVVNLATPEGMAAFSAQWKNMDVKIVEAPAMPNAGPAWKSSYDITPKAGDANFDDSSWPAIEPKGLLERRGGGHLFMTWYRANLTVPAKIGDFDTAGATAVLTFTIDDYAEAWVNGQIRAGPEDRVPRQSRASTCQIASFLANKSNRATNSRLRSSVSTGRSHSRQQIRFSSARRRSSFTAESSCASVWRRGVNRSPLGRRRWRGDP